MAYPHLNDEEREKVRAYMRAYYREHSTHAPMIAGAERQSKICRQCGIDKPRSSYSICKRGPRTGHLRAYCKPCCAEIQGEQYRAKVERLPDHYRRYEWPSKLKRLYGITVDEYFRLLAAQGGVCALCGSDNPVAGNRTYKRTTRIAFDVDHCHRTGRVRGLLCTRCNRLVGLANDSLETALKLVEYLRQKGE